MFTKHDEKFTEMAVNPERRLAAITDLTHRRAMMCWSALLFSLCAIMSSFGSKSAGAGCGFSAAIMWMLVFKYESDLRLLKVIERLRK